MSRGCQHEFYCIVIVGLWSGRWKCKYCGLKVSDRADAEALEGGAG